MRRLLWIFGLLGLGCGSASIPAFYPLDINGSTVWASHHDESLRPQWITTDSFRTRLAPGDHWFKLTADSGFTYSIVVDAGLSDDCDPSVDGTRRDCQRFEMSARRAKAGLTGEEFEFAAFGYEGSLHGVPMNYSPAKTALIFTQDQARQFVYLRIHNMAGVELPAFVKIMKFREKLFTHPLISRPVSSRGISYFNLFRHRTRLYRGLTRNGHDGIDLAMTSTDTARGSASVVQEAVAVADGVVLKAHLESCAIGHIVWIRHDTPYGIFTSMYAHLSSTFVESGRRVKKGERIGYVAEDPLCDGGYYGHLHFEMWDRIEAAWHDGYSSGNGQIDPLEMIFYR